VSQIKRVAIYCRVSTRDQQIETQWLDLREMAKQRGFEIVHEYTAVISGTKSKRPGLDPLLADARSLASLCRQPALVFCERFLK
jgi:putative DNA-invertase from lambdoid prophage Rac